MFKLAERQGGNAGLYCGADGLFLGRSPLIARIGATYRIRADDEIARLLAAACNSLDKAEGLRPRLRLIRSALQDGDYCRAMILAVQARLGPMAPESIARLAQTEAISKYSFNPDEPRDWHGRWTTWEGGTFPGEAGANGHPALPSGERPTPSINEIPIQVAQSGPLNFSAHAWRRMRERNITADQVMDAIQSVG